jgi:hypothetical protein
LVSILLVSLAGLSSAQSKPARPCDARPEHRQFDFWIGEWDVTVKGQAAGTNSIQLILDKCVLQENWTGSKGGVGKSFNFFNAATNRWQQTWVDNGGGVLEFSGEFRDGAMRFQGETPNKGGGKTLNRMTFTPLPDEKVRQVIENSKDDGKTWTVGFDGLYSRRKSAGDGAK